MRPRRVVSKLAREGISLASKLKKIGVQKEFWYKRASELKRTLQSLIGKIKFLKSKKDDSNIKVEEYKKERDRHNGKVRELIKQIRGLNKEKIDLTKKYGIKFDPSSIKAKIEKLDMKIETEAISFNKEKKIMEEIKRLKRLFAESGNVKEVVDKIDNLSKEIDDSKKKAEDYHKKLREYFKESKNYNEFIELSKKIDEIKKKQENAFNTFRLLKKEHGELNKKLNGKKEKEKRKKEIKEERKKKVEERIIEEKAKKVEEKLKTEKKLTTEDLIAYQGKNGSS